MDPRTASAASVRILAAHQRVLVSPESDIPGMIPGPAPFHELKARACNQIRDCARHEHFTGIGERRHALADVNGDATDVLTAQLNFAGVESGPDLDTK